MKKITVVVLLFGLFGGQALRADEDLSREAQREIIENYQYLMGQEKSRPYSTTTELSLGEISEELPIKCGTPTMVRFQSNLDKFDRDLVSALDVDATDRPDLPLAYDTPGGHFRLHYDTTGENAIWANLNVDVGGNGVPDYIDSVARIAEEVFDYVVDSLGFSPPVADTACFEGENELYDIYLLNLTSNVFGWTKADTECAVPGSFLMQVPSFIEMDNDYQSIKKYIDRPLDAVRVTVAHEFFHAIQFSMDYTEILNLYWLEMSATWIEEEIYDDINDYYSYLPFFYPYPRTSIQRFSRDLGDSHPYGSVVFPIYLSETYGSEMMRLIWQNCVDLGHSQGDFLAATELMIDSLASVLNVDSVIVPPDYVTAYGQFSLWNFFTGARAASAPPGIGFSEGAVYPIIPRFFEFGTGDTIFVFPEFNEYPVALVRVNDNRFKPEHNAMTLLHFASLQNVQEDRFWECGNPVPWFNPDCNDTLESIEVLVEDTALGYDRQDSLFSLSGGFESLALPFENVAYPWSVSIIYQMADVLDSFEVETYLLPSNLCEGYNCLQNIFRLDMVRVNKFNSATVIFTAASPIETKYVEHFKMGLAYQVKEIGEGDTAVVEPERFEATNYKLVPYPNPAVVSQMGNEGMVTFKASIDLDVFYEFSFIDDEAVFRSTDFDLMVDIFTVAGEKVASLTDADTSSIMTVLLDPFNASSEEFEIKWNMKNEAGREVASGVYIAVAQLFYKRSGIGLSPFHGRRQLGIYTGKVAIIR